MDTLYTPWRYDWITDQAPEPGCFLCRAAEEPDDPERLVVHVAEHHLVMLNRYPYSNGHLMVAPRLHLASPREAAAPGRVELWPVMLKAQAVLTRVYSPGGFNFGMNLGRAAGAGVPDHFHFHVVPRWSGDTNFMTVVGGVRLVPEELGAAWARLRAAFAAEEE